MDARPPARLFWQLFEPFHAITYFAAESHQSYEEAGLRGFWRGYFAGRAAPLGPDDAQRLIELLRPIAAKLVDDGTIPYPNPIGVQAPVLV